MHIVFVENNAVKFAVLSSVTFSFSNVSGCKVFLFHFAVRRIITSASCTRPLDSNHRGDSGINLVQTSYLYNLYLLKINLNETVANMFTALICLETEVLNI